MSKLRYNYSLIDYWIPDSFKIFKLLPDKDKCFCPECFQVDPIIDVQKKLLNMPDEEFEKYQENDAAFYKSDEF